MKFKAQQSGQALLEYLFVFLIMITVGVAMAKGMSSYFGNTLTSLSAVLSKELAVGVCETDCVTDSYRNRTQ